MSGVYMMSDAAKETKGRIDRAIRILIIVTTVIQGVVISLLISTRAEAGVSEARLLQVLYGLLTPLVVSFIFMVSGILYDNFVLRSLSWYGIIYVLALELFFFYGIGIEALDKIGGGFTLTFRNSHLIPYLGSLICSEPFTRKYPFTKSKRKKGIILGFDFRKRWVAWIFWFVFSQFINRYLFAIPIRSLSP